VEAVCELDEDVEVELRLEANVISLGELRELLLVDVELCTPSLVSLVLVLLLIEVLPTVLL